MRKRRWVCSPRHVIEVQNLRAGAFADSSELRRRKRSGRQRTVSVRSRSVLNRASACSRVEKPFFGSHRASSNSTLPRPILCATFWGEARTEIFIAPKNRTFRSLNRLNPAEQIEMSGQNKIHRVEASARPCEAILPGAIPLTEEKRLPEQAEVVSSHYQRIFRAALSLTWDRDLAEEIVQETFCAAFSRLHSFSGRSSVFTWLYRIMLNKYRDQCRKKSLLRRLGIVRAKTDIRTRDGTSSAPSPGAQLAISEERWLLRNAVERLPKRLRMVVVMHYFDGLPINEVAEVLDCPLGTVKSRLFAARKRLFQLLRGKLRDGYTSTMSQI